MRRLALLSPALIAGLVGALLSAAPARADAGDCGVTVAQPASLTITSTLMHVPVVLRDAANGCAKYASFDVVRSDGADTSIVILDGRRQDSWLLDSSDGPGRYGLQLRSAYDQGSDDVALQSTGPQLDARFASALSTVKATRSKTKARLVAKATQYRYLRGFVAAAGRKVVFERSTGGGWTAMKTIRTDRKGVAVASLKTSRSTKWRARLLDSGSAWGAVSGARTPVGPAPEAAVPVTPVRAPSPAPVVTAPPAPICPAGRLYGGPTSASAIDRGSYSDYYDVTVTGYTRNDSNQAVEVDDFGPKISGYDASGYERFTGYASSDYPDQYLAADGTFVLQPGASVNWSDTVMVLKADWPLVRSISGSPTEEYLSDWANASVSSTCAGPEQDYATRPVLRR